MAASADDLIQVGEIGEVIAKSITGFFSIPYNRELIEKLKRAGVQLAGSGMERVSDRLKGKSFVISGVFKGHSREEMQKMIEANGGRNLGSVSSNTNYVVAGEGMGPAKKEKAAKMGIPVITEEEFLRMIGKG
jgi:DNA ligase (NAD+)